MKEPIEPKDIREGDLIRREPLDSRSLRAVEYVAHKDGYTHGLSDSDTDVFYLLDRPIPAVDLPTEPTLGWLTDQEGEFLTHAWLSQSEPGKAELEVGIYRPSCDEYTVAWMYPRQDEVAAFTPAVAVPRAALDDLRDSAHRAFFGTNLYPAIETFLKAIDAANGDPQ